MATLTLPDSPHQTALPPRTSASRGRVHAIDAVRGLLMCVITVGHSLILLDDSESNRWLSLLITKITNLGTPGFTLISGMLLGYFESTYVDFHRIRNKYFIRGVQLLTVAHLLIAWAIFPLRKESSFIEVYFRYWYITDTLAILFMVLPTWAPRLGLRARVVLGTLCLLSWKLFSFIPSPSAPLPLVVKEFLFGVSSRGAQLLGDTYPIIPLAGLFIIGTALGNRFAQSFVEARLDRFTTMLRRNVAPLILFSGLLVGLWALGKLSPGSPFGSALKMLFYPEKLFSLLPFYISALFLILAYFIQRIEIQARFGPIAKMLTLFGKTSLFTYVAQYFLVQTIPSFIGWRNQMNAVEMTLYLGGTFMMLFGLAHVYNESFLKRRSQLKKTEETPNRTTGDDVSPLLDSPELLGLKKDLW